MQEITEEQINEAYNNWMPASFPTNKSAFTDGLKQGFELSQEQLQPKWITVNGIADLPTDNERYWCEVGDRVLFLDGNEMRFYKITRYTPVIKPVPPKQ